MSTIIGGAASFVSRAMRDMPDASARLDAEPSLDAGQEAEANVVFDVQAQMAEVEDEMGSVIAQFGRFRTSERKTRRSEDFERILDSEPEEKLGDLGKALEGAKADLATLMREARQRFRDDSDLLLAFRELRRRKKIEGEPVDLIEKAIDEVLKEGDQKQIKAGINVALKAKVFGMRMQLDPARLRQLYRQFLEFDGTPLVVYEDWIEQFGACRRKRIMEYVGAALTCDMQSLDPSCGCPVEFGPLLGTLGNVRMLSSSDELFVGRMLGDTLARENRYSEESALRLMLGGLQQPFDIETVVLDVLGSTFASLDPRSRCELMQLVVRGFASIPLALYDELEARHALVAKLQDMLGELYVRERRRAHRDATCS
ncbi:type III secretion protein [Burkholderia sp. ABCPW 14]|uniref:type III secretion system gatekeeper subunit SctW n=1 Tax=Burkholderia sp. ABCPW 14 TaxID=1637860 RepID=UPI000770D69F|nr:type III secretion system gatekeeper subunit SctW [Burkholderia sp. ABCPW 14]KVD78008.1 type III secretion protein [Burkholderia sp. ABCPW 14]